MKMQKLNVHPKITVEIIYIYYVTRTSLSIGVFRYTTVARDFCQWSHWSLRKYSTPPKTKILPQDYLDPFSKIMGAPTGIESTLVEIQDCLCWGGATILPARLTQANMRNWNILLGCLCVSWNVHVNEHHFVFSF